MSESSYWPFVYVFFSGILLTCILIKLRENRLKPTFNTNITSIKEMEFSKSHLLQFNATIIAGLFILLTVQGSTGGISLFTFIDTMTLQKIQEEYEKIMNDPNEDPLVKEEATKRFVEIKLDLQKEYIQINSDYDMKALKLLLHPLSYFSISLIFLVGSSIAAMSSNNEGDRRFKTGEVLTVFGLMFILTGSYIMVAI